MKGVHAKVVVTIKVQKLKDKLKVRTRPRIWIYQRSAQLTLSCSTTGRAPLLRRADPARDARPRSQTPAGPEKLRAISARPVPNVLSRPNATADLSLPTLGTALLELLDSEKSSASSTH